VEVAGTHQVSPDRSEQRTRTGKAPTSVFQPTRWCSTTFLKMGYILSTEGWTRL